MHPETQITVASQRVAERTAAAERWHRPWVGQLRPDLRTRVGTALVRWGTRLARSPASVSEVPTGVTGRPCAGVTMAR
ncbi:hypothetical protein BH20ACT4_BH20ACT4_03710 [soil metagenome]